MGSPTVNPEQSQYIKLPDGSYGKFRSDASDEQIRGAITKDFPDAFAAKPPAAANPPMLDRLANEKLPPPTGYLDAASRGLADVGQGVFQAANAARHPIDALKSATQIGPKVMDFLSGSGEHTGQTPVQSAAEMAKNAYEHPAETGQKASNLIGQTAAGMGIGEAAPAVAELAPKLVPSVKTLTAPVRMAARSAEGLGSIPGVGSTLKTLRNAAYANTPVEDIPKFKMPLQNFGLSKNAGAPLPEAPTPAQTLQSRIATERGISNDQLAQPKRSEGLSEVEAAQPQAEQHLRTAVDAQHTRAAPPPNTSRANMGKLLNDATGGQALKPNVPLRQQLSNVTPARGESSVIKSHSYDPAASELTVTLKDGRTYVHGDVSPEQAESLDKADSKGRAWTELKRNATYVGKVINGKRVYAQPPVDLRKMTPQSQPPVAGEDLTPILKESLKRTKKK